MSSPRRPSPTADRSPNASERRATEDTAADRLQELAARPAVGTGDVAEVAGLRQQSPGVGCGDIGIEHRHLLRPCGIRVRA